MNASPFIIPTYNIILANQGFASHSEGYMGTLSKSCCEHDASAKINDVKGMVLDNGAIDQNRRMKVGGVSFIEGMRHVEKLGRQF